MEFPTLGEHCQEPTCKQTDFLPMKCKCGGVFCREHFTPHCLSTGCGLPSMAKGSEAREPDQLYHCTSADCGTSSLHEMLCTKCSKHFCIEHRFHPECPEIDEDTLSAKREEFAAPRRQFQVSNIPIQQQITENIRKALQCSPKAKTASKVQLMRIKQKAVGPKTLPVQERAYFSVVKPKDVTAKAVKIIKIDLEIPRLEVNFDLKNIISIFVSRKWSLGRAIDTICDSCSIVNNNNKPDTNKARLFRQSDGYCLGDGRMDVEIGELLMQNLLLEGDSLIVEYVASGLATDDCIFLKLPVESARPFEQQT